MVFALKTFEFYIFGAPETVKKTEKIGAPKRSNYRGKRAIWETLLACGSNQRSWDSSAQANWHPCGQRRRAAETLFAGSLVAGRDWWGGERRVMVLVMVSGG